MLAQTRGFFVNEAEAKAEEQANREPAQGASPEGDGAVSAQASEPQSDAVAKELEEAQAEAARLKDQLLRTAADFDNYRKRSRREVEDAHHKGLERALLEVLPVADNLERAIQAGEKTSDVASLLEGIRMVLKLLEDSFGRLGVERVPAVGAAFDPSIHEAVQQVETDEAAPGTVVTEMIPGYRLKGKLLRAAMVSVAKAKPQPSAEAPSEGSAPN
jgi:molecular chaperone GrpE